MKHSNGCMCEMCITKNIPSKRTWLTQYTDIEIMIIKLVFQHRMNTEIANYFGISVKGLGFRISNMFEKMGIKYTKHSRSLVLYHFGSKYSAHMNEIMQFEYNPVVKDDKNLKRREEIAAKIDYILLHEPHHGAREHLHLLTLRDVNAVWKLVKENQISKMIKEQEIEDIQVYAPVLPFQGNDVNLDKTRILMLFPPAKNHKYIQDGNKSE